MEVIVAIDVHVHLCDESTQAPKATVTAQMARYFGRERNPGPHGRNGSVSIARAR